MKSMVRITIGILAVCGILFYIAHALNQSSGASGKKILTVYNWGEYIDPSLLKKFEKETGIHVIYETFDSNEAMMTKIEQGGTNYDIAIPSEYTIEQMKEKDLLLPIDHNKIMNLQNIDEDFLDLPFDKKNKYSIPYFWGTVGIVYNPKLLGKGYDFDNWNDLWDPSLKGKVVLVDSAREVMGVGLNSMGKSLNSTDSKELSAATDKLIKMAPNVKAIIGDEVTQLMINEDAAVALTWSGQAADMMFENEDLTYAVPSAGSNLWFDNMVIPRTSKNLDGAHKFINFMLNPENAAQNADYVGYSTPNKAAMKLLDPEVISDERYYPSKETRKNLHVYKNLGLEKIGEYNEYFLKFKMAIR
ncbi:ABC transporter substrate-binding protein [Kurthia sibirica]|uniref:Spermidine/putrescine ABC transporter substrate-binding protein n=1 Tax=Kurthia sibirica TaxID=202750 RepID=A0A2U3AQH6_9BACL|nr:ABC transporter substrate-binding protein [Kurthia sibirica]PWI26756.1 spermidine/putrescine ABC transporter substrate-binding protein [Kurthia sibirica]GEK32713.1 spermidine/putrescine ABC transporter substrate-binding protein [Kurthia sibirica]